MKNKNLFAAIFVVFMLLSITVVSSSGAQYASKNEGNRETGQLYQINKIPVVKGSVTIGNLTFSIKTNKVAYWLREPIHITLSVTNTGDEDEMIKAPTSKTSDFAVLNRLGRKMYKWSDGKAFLQVITETAIPAGETVYFNHTWNQKGTYFPWMPLIFRHQVRPSEYFIKGIIPYSLYAPLSSGSNDPGCVVLYTKIYIDRVGILS